MSEQVAAMLPIIGALGTLATALVGILRYFTYRTHRDKLSAIRDNFDKVVASLRSTSDVERAAGAVLLRRFFDPHTEGGTAPFPRIAKLLHPIFGTWVHSGTPYAREAIGVIASILRTSGSGALQKLLADGLAYAPSLRAADLQRTNLRNAYFGSRHRTVGDSREPAQVDMSEADFFCAEISDASLKNVLAAGTVFYQARMQNTVLAGAHLQTADFREADLRGADFRGADLENARFEGAILEGANFTGTLNLPQILTKGLKEGRWRQKGPVHALDATYRPAPPKVFLAKPGCLDYRQRHLVEMFCAWAEEWDFTTQSLDREAYPERGAVEELSRRISQAHGLVIFGFGELEVVDALWRKSTPEERRITEKLTTAWCQIEAGMAVAYAIPVLAIPEPDVKAGIFGPGLKDESIYVMQADEGPDSAVLVEWREAVRKRAALG